MPGWNEIMNDLKQKESPLDSERHKYLKNLSDLTGRNVITYYSSWLTKEGAPNLDINDSDMEGFMNAVKGLDCNIGLDLILHTPGGSPVAAESIVTYLRSKFNKEIRVIVPHLAMSAGTMIACSAKEIIMGRQSSLGPIDPQFSGIPAYNIKSEFLEAKSDLSENPQNVAYWSMIFQKYPAAFLKSALDAIDLSDELLKNWLSTCMFDDSNIDYSETIEKIAKNLNEHNSSKNHGRHFDIEKCKNIGLKIIQLENDAGLQDAVLSLHHLYTITLGQTNTCKIIENQNGLAYVSLINN